MQMINLKENTRTFFYIAACFCFSGGRGITGILAPDSPFIVRTPVSFKPTLDEKGDFV